MTCDTVLTPAPVPNECQVWWPWTGLSGAASLCSLPPPRSKFHVPPTGSALPRVGLRNDRHFQSGHSASRRGEDAEVQEAVPGLSPGQPGAGSPTVWSVDTAVSPTDGVVWAAAAREGGATVPPLPHVLSAPEPGLAHRWKVWECLKCAGYPPNAGQQFTAVKSFPLPKIILANVGGRWFPFQASVGFLKIASSFEPSPLIVPWLPPVGHGLSKCMAVGGVRA